MTIDNLEHAIEYMKHLSEDIESSLDMNWSDFLAIVSSLSGYEELAELFHESGIGFTFIHEDDDYKPIPQQLIDYINHEEPISDDKELCTYPDCKCPFDMTPDMKCLKGFKSE